MWSSAGAVLGIGGAPAPVRPLYSMTSYRAVGPLRVIHIGPAPSSVGGTQSVLRTIEEHSIGADHVSVVSTWDGPAPWTNALRVLRAAAVIAGSGRETIIHLHMTDGGAYLREGFLLLLARLLGRKAIVSLHSGDFPGFSRRHPGFARAILLLARQLTCLCDETERAVAGIVGSDRVVQMPVPVLMDLEASPAAETPPVVLFAGRVDRMKGADILVEAWRLLLSRGVPGYLRIVGPRGDFAPPALDRLTVEGPVDPGEMRSLIRQARVIVLPSRSEGMPVILAEALASGRPFVATPVGGTAQLAPSSEALVPIEDPRALAAGIERHLRDAKFAQEMGDRGRELCRATRSPEVIDVMLRELYARA